MTDECTVPPTVAESTGSSPNLARSYDKLQQLLQQNDGVISSMLLKRSLIEDVGFQEPEAKGLMAELKFLDDTASQRIGRPDAKTYHHGRSFYSSEKYEEVEAETEKEAETKWDEAAEEPEEEEAEETQSRRNRREEARLGTYVKKLLEDIYYSDCAPEEKEYVFDVHKEHSGSTFENVDLLAVHWRTENIVDLVTVEVKLQFSARAVHQACNYRRFSHRVWVAALVTGDLLNAAQELRSVDPGLFDYTVFQGLGIIACRRAQGRAYQTYAIHWPRWQNPEPVERVQFSERYRTHLEEAGVLEPKDRRPSARF